MSSERGVEALQDFSADFLPPEAYVAVKHKSRVVYDNLHFTERDVIIAGYPKSGTNFLQQICHQVKMRGGDEEYEQLTDEVPLLDLCGVLGGTDLAKPQKGDFRIFKWHQGFDEIPPSALKSKFIVILRDPVATFASNFDYQTRFWPELQGVDISHGDFYRHWVMSPMARYPGLWWNVVTSWLAGARDQTNCLVLFYESLLSDLGPNLDRVSEFLGVRLSAEEKARVTHLSSFEYMSTQQAKYDLHGLREDIQRVQAAIRGVPYCPTPAPPLVFQGPGRETAGVFPQWALDDMDTWWRLSVGRFFGYTDYAHMRSSIEAACRK